MTPAPGTRLVRFVGDRLRVALRAPGGAPPGVRALLRTDLTRAARGRALVLRDAANAAAEPARAWRDIPLEPTDEGFALELPLLEAGSFRAKAYCTDASGRQLWPEGEDLVVCVHPDRLRTANTIYCAFVRTAGRGAVPSAGADGTAIRALERRGYRVMAPSGTLRGMLRILPHVFDTLSCRVLQLLPVGPASLRPGGRGSFGSPYAPLDLTAIDPALVEPDRRTSAVEQFRELADAVHARGGLLLLDVVLNHTGWSSRLLEQHPDWFLRDPDGAFRSAGAWGITWEDTVELDARRPPLWDALAEALLVWCRRGVDGFRLDAGYKIPLPAWRSVVTRVRDEFPECVFLLEGLGGALSATEDLLSRIGMQWAYSELFQCHTPRHVADCLDHALAASESLGRLVHFSETHDNDRLAARGPRWALLRHRLCALASVSGGFGYSAGAEWLCTEKIDVSEARPLAWGAEPNLVAEVAQLGRLLAQHPCFFDGARVERHSAPDAPVLALERCAREGGPRCLVLVNLDAEHAHASELPAALWARCGSGAVDLLGQPPPRASAAADRVRVKLAPGAAYCLAASPAADARAGDVYRAQRAGAAWTLVQIGCVVPHEAIGAADFRALAAFADEDPAGFLAALGELDPGACRSDLLGALRGARARVGYARVVVLRADDARRVTPVPPDHWVLVEDDAAFELHASERAGARHLRSVALGGRQVAALPPVRDAHGTVLELRRFGASGARLELRRLAAEPEPPASARAGVVLLTNGRGAMSRLQVDLGAIESKYDCLLAANLEPRAPGERHVFAKRVRAWANANGFLTPLDARSLVAVEAGPPAAWTFLAGAGDGRSVGVRLAFELLAERNALVLRLARAPGPEAAPAVALSVTLRVDLEDRSFHAETRADAELEARFERGTRPLAGRPGFLFVPAPGRELRVVADRGAFLPEREWCRDVAHPADAARGVGSHGDAFSPGWFEIPLADGAPAALLVCADPTEPPLDALAGAPGQPPIDTIACQFGEQLRRAARAFVARRGSGLTVIAGYPWFLDWGRDTCVAARGLAAAGCRDEAWEILRTQAALERGGTLPNFMDGEREGSRETSDAPLWLALACEELAAQVGPELYARPVGPGRTLADVLLSIGDGYLRGCANGVRADAASRLVWSPAHFTWMDTNHPAATPREGFPIEVNALWIRLLRQLARIAPARDFAAIAARAEESLELFWREDLGHCADTLHAPRDTEAWHARPDDHLRPNQLLAVALDVLRGPRARAVVAACARELLVPGALRSLAPRRVAHLLPVRAPDGALLGDPAFPYCGRYEGDEDRSRKPAYHNGTAWVWWLPIHCEAMLRAHPGDRAALDAARALLGSSASLLDEGCLGQLPEILDGDAPHSQRGCDAQAWSATETLRVWLALERASDG